MTVLVLELKIVADQFKLYLAATMPHFILIVKEVEKSKESSHGTFSR